MYPCSLPFQRFFRLTVCFDATSLIEKILVLCFRDKEILERLDTCKDYNHIPFY